MAEQTTRQFDDLGRQIATLESCLQTTTTKDLSLVSLVTTLSGSPEEGPLQAFVTSGETTAEIGSWTDLEKVGIASLTLSESARAFYDATPELQDRELKWSKFKSLLQQQFRDPRTEQFHYVQLHSVRQSAQESVADFADRCKNLARKVTLHVEDESASNVCNEQVERMLLASFTSGLQGNPGKHTRFSMPSTTEDAIKMAVTVEQAETCDRRNDSFYVNDKARNTHYLSHAAESDEQGKSAPSAYHQGKTLTEFLWAGCGELLSDLLAFISFPKAYLS
jgi:hypothetical protein